MSRSQLNGKYPAARCKVGPADVREWQIRTITQSGDEAKFADITQSIAASVTTLSQQPAMPTAAATPSEYGFEDIYVLFESQYKIDPTTLSSGAVSFSVTDLNNNVPISDVVQVSVDDFWFPAVTSPSAYSPDFFYFRKVYMQIAELPNNQSFQARNFQYHFEFNVTELSSVAVRLVPVNRTYTLRQPLSTLSAITLRFFVPQNSQRVPLPIDYVRVRAVPGTNPARFTMLGGYTTEVLAPIGPIAAPGVAVYFNGFVSNNPNANNTINDVNGIFITNIVDTTTFETTNANFAPVTTQSECNMLIGKNRFSVSMTFTSIKAAKFTNGLDYTH